MSEITIHMLRLLVNERLSVASDEIFGIIEKTLIEHHAEVSRLNKEVEYHRKLLGTVLKPADHHRLSSVSVLEEMGLPEQQFSEPAWSPSPQVKDEPEPLQIKEEPEEVETTPRDEHQGQEADTDEFSSTQTCVTPDHSEDQSQFSDLDRSVDVAEEDGLPPTAPKRTTNQTKQTKENEQRKYKRDFREQVQLRTKQDGVNHGRPVARRVETGHTDGRQRGELGANLRILQTPIGRAVRKSPHVLLSRLKLHSHSHGGLSSCKVCVRHFYPNGSSGHVRSQTKDEKYSNSQSFTANSEMMNHMNAALHSRMTAHIRHKPYCCHVCGEDFSTCGRLNKHMIMHTLEKPYSCQVCGKRVSSSRNLAKHMKIHSQEEHY